MSISRATREVRPAPLQAEPVSHVDRHWRERNMRAAAAEVLSIGAAGEVAAFLLSEVERLGEPVTWE